MIYDALKCVKLTYNKEVKSVKINSPGKVKSVKNALCWRSTLETVAGVFIFVKFAHQRTNHYVP
jgi:hypothetical protein